MTRELIDSVAPATKDAAPVMKIIRDLPALRRLVSAWKSRGHSVAFVPTMGNLHGGHLSLLERARTLAERTVASIFVNPIQFGTGEDYQRYPSTLDADARMLSESGLDLLFCPDLAQLYPAGTDSDTRVTVPDLSHILCGEFRPGHFSGVATVVTKLLINVQPDVALFGEKDFQQLLVIKRLVADLCLPVEIIGMPIVREADGLAMSSRNAYLSVDDRKRAPLIFKALQSAADHLRRGRRDYTKLECDGFATLAAAGFRPEYFKIRRTLDLGEPRADDTRVSVLAAAWVGPARLIDNVKVLLD